MAQITGGKVTFRRNVQPAQYEGREAIVEIGFAVDEGATDAAAEAIVSHAGVLAKSKALELVASDKVTAPVTPVSGKADAAKPKPRTKADLEKEAKAKGGAAPEDTGLELPEDKPQISTSPEDRKPAEPDPDLDLPADGAEAQPITDKELLDAVTKKNAAISKPKEIKALRAKFTQGQSVKDIPADKRAEFLKELEALA